jgi:ketol-acid reductoisomerase
MRARTYHDADADTGVLDGKTVAVIGYGNQGHAQAQNLRDSGVGVIVGNRDDEYKARATEHGFDVFPIAEAARRADVLLLLIPDEVQPEVMAGQIAPGLSSSATLVVASGYNVAFGLLAVPDGADVVMVAPRMIGVGVRSRFRDRKPYPCFVSAERDVSGTALATALAVARGIGATAGGAVASSAREEAALDLFSEQAIWPTLLAVLHAAYEVLAGSGFSDDAILDEMYLSGEPAEIFARAADMGLLGQLPTHSRTSQYGQLSRLGRSADLMAALRDRFGSVMRDDILSGVFAREWSDLLPDADETLRKLREQAAARPLIAAENQVRASPSGA